MKCIAFAINVENIPFIKHFIPCSSRCCYFGYILNSCSGTGVIDRLMNGAQITDEKPPSNAK